MGWRVEAIIKYQSAFLGPEGAYLALYATVSSMYFVGTGPRRPMFVLALFSILAASELLSDRLQRAISRSSSEERRRSKDDGISAGRSRDASLRCARARRSRRGRHPSRSSARPAAVRRAAQAGVDEGRHLHAAAPMSRSSFARTTRKAYSPLRSRSLGYSLLAELCVLIAICGGLSPKFKIRRLSARFDFALKFES